MKKTLTILFVLAPLGLLGLFIAIASPTLGAQTLAASSFPEPILAIASYRGQAANASGALSPSTAYLPVDARDTDLVLYVQNEAAAAGSIGITFRDADGLQVEQIAASLPARASLAYPLAGLTHLPADFVGSAAVTSTRSIHTLINGRPPSGRSLLSYSSVPTGTEEIILPLVFREAYGYNSTVLVHNVGAAPAAITIHYYPHPQGFPYLDTDTIPAGGTKFYDQQDIADLGAPFSGWAHIESSQPLAVAVVVHNSASGHAAAYNGLTQETADLGFLVPYQLKTTAPSWVSGVDVSNQDADSAIITTTWRTSGGTEALSTSTPGVPFGQPSSYFAPILFPGDLDGALWGTANHTVAALNTLNASSARSDGLAIDQATTLEEAGPVIYLPRLANVPAQGLASAFTVQNVSNIAATVAITFYHQAGSVAAVLDESIPGNGFQRFLTTGLPSLGDDWQGSAVVHASQSVAVEVLQFLIGLPHIQVSPASLSIDLVQGDTAWLPLTIANDGDDDLDWSLVEVPAVGWLDTTPLTSTVLPGGHTELEVGFDAAGLAAGTYTTTLQIASNDPTTPTVEVPVTLNVADEFRVFVPAVLRDLRFGIGNGDFEQGPVVWEQHSPYGPTMIVSSDDIPSYVIEPHSGKWFAMLGGGAMQAETHDIDQTFYLPASTPYLAYWYEIWSEDSCGYDYGKVLVDGTVVDQLDLCEPNITDRWYKRVLDLSSYAGQVISLQIQLDVDASLISVFYVDDVGLQSTSAAAQGTPSSR